MAAQDLVAVGDVLEDLGRPPKRKRWHSITDAGPLGCQPLRHALFRAWPMCGLPLA
jgi:hypothetical protein